MQFFTAAPYKPIGVQQWRAPYSNADVSTRNIGEGLRRGVRTHLMREAKLGLSCRGDSDGGARTRPCSVSRRT